MKPGKKAAQNSIIDVDLGKRTATVAYATYKSLDRDKDRAFKGMFSKSWQEFEDVRVFLNHDKTLAPARLETGNGVGKMAQSFWEDDDHAYAKMWFGTHTLGEDTLKMMDEKLITDSSYLFLPMPNKFKKNEAGGFNFYEVFLKEVSVLTHWGAHPESKVVSVNKSANDIVIEEQVLKQLNQSEVDMLRSFISEFNGNLVSLAAFAASLPETSDIYTWVNYLIGDLSYTVTRFKDKLVYGQKSWTTDELSQHLQRLKSFARNSTASDATLQKIASEAEQIEALFFMDNDTHAKDGHPHEQPKVPGNEADQLALLNIKMLLS